MDQPSASRIPPGRQYEYSSFPDPLYPSPSPLTRPEEIYQHPYEHSTAPMSAAIPTGLQLQHSSGELSFSFSYPPANLPSAPAQFSTFPSASGSSSSRSFAKLNSERDEVFSDDMGDSEDMDPKHSPRQGSAEPDISPKKKLRVMLPRGRACVTCRNRKLKCSGERPCGACVKAETDCRYEEIQRRKPRHVLLEERVVELEALLISRGEKPPPSQLTTATPTPTHILPSPSPNKGDVGDVGLHLPPAARPKTKRKISSTSVNRDRTPPSSAPPSSQSLSLVGRQDTPHSQHPRSHSGPPTNQLALSLHSHRDILPFESQTIPSVAPFEIHPRTLLEIQLISFVLPYTTFIAIPLHPQRFLALLTLDPSHPSRPHPALLCILFAEGIRILEQGVPHPKRQVAPGFADFASSMPGPLSEADKAWLLSQVRGASLTFLERARTELDNGIRNVDRPFDLVRAAVGIASYLYSIGRFIEGWNIPIARLVVSCGLHRQSGNITRPQPPPASGEYPPSEYVPPPYAETQPYVHHQALTAPPQNLPAIRMRPVILPPPRDDIEVAERVLTFWAAKMQDWAAGVGWGWTVALDDEECTTEWPWGFGSAEDKPLSQINQRFGIRDLFDITSPMHLSPFPDSSYVLSIKSTCLLQRASHLNDLPESSVPYPRPDGRLLADHIPPMHKIHSVETAISLLRQRLPAEYTYPPHIPRQFGSSGSSDVSGYIAMSDPWYILLHINLYTAEMLTWREMANYDAGAYHRAIACAREIVRIVSGIKAEDWVHIDMLVAVDLSLVARILYKESDRLHNLGQALGAKMAGDEADYLRGVLAGDFARWLPMAALQSIIVGRVREGMTEKEGEYDRM